KKNNAPQHCYVAAHHHRPALALAPAARGSSAAATAATDQGAEGDEQQGGERGSGACGLAAERLSGARGGEVSRGANLNLKLGAEACGADAAGGPGVHEQRPLGLILHRRLTQAVANPTTAAGVILEAAEQVEGACGVIIGRQGLLRL